MPSPITGDTVNPGNPAQRFVPANSVVVNVAEPPEHPDQVNRLPNPDAAYGAYGWTTQISTHLMVSETPTGTDTRRLPPERRAAYASAITGNITVVDATHIQVVPAASTTALGFPAGMTAIDPGSDYRVAIERVPALMIGSLPIVWNVVTTPAVGAPAGTPWLLEAASIGVALTPGTITPPANGYLVNYGSYFRTEFSQITETETDVDTTLSSARMGCVPGDKIRFSMQLLGQPVRLDTGAALTNATRFFWFNYYKADGTLLTQVASSSATIAAGVTTVTFSPAAVVPAGAVEVSLNINFAWPVDSPAEVEMRFARPLVQMGAAPSLVEEWPVMRNIFDSSSTLTYERRAMDSSTYELVTTDPTYDPAVSTLIRKGARVEAYIAENNDPTYPGNLDRLFTAKVDQVSAEYPRHNGKIKPIITITFDDGMSDLASLPRAGGYADLSSLPNVLEGGIVPWNVTGQTGQSGVANIPDWTNDNASALDQVAITRDTHHAYAWLDRWGVFNVHAGGVDGTLDTYTRQWSVDEGNISGTAVPELSTDELINTCMITALRQIGDQTEEWKYGPYYDRGSIDVYGQRLATFTVGVPAGEVVNSAYFDAFVAEVFAKNAAPYKGYRVLPFSIDGNFNALAFATVDLCDELLVTSADTGFVDEPFRVSAVKHTITTTRWLLELETTAPDSVAAPTAQPDLASTSTPGWAPITLLSGITATPGLAPEVSSLGDIIFVRGEVQGTFGAGAVVNVGTIPEGYRPADQNYQVATVANNAEGRVRFSMSGNVDVRFAEATTFANICAVFRRN